MSWEDLESDIAAEFSAWEPSIDDVDAAQLSLRLSAARCQWDKNRLHKKPRRKRARQPAEIVASKNRARVAAWYARTVAKKSSRAYRRLLRRNAKAQRARYARNRAQVTLPFGGKRAA